MSAGCVARRGCVRASSSTFRKGSDGKSSSREYLRRGAEAEAEAEAQVEVEDGAEAEAMHARGGR
jgi:hypothetical protein